MAFAAFLLEPPVRTDEVKAADLINGQAWSRATPGGAKVGGGYNRVVSIATGRRRFGDRARKTVELPVTPNFEKAGKVSIGLDVEGIGAMSTSGGGTMDTKTMPVLKRARFF